MLLRKTAWSWKSGLAVISFVLMLSVSGCSDAPPEEDTVSETVIDIQAIPEDSKENAEEIINICIDLYKKAAEENKIASSNLSLYISIFVLVIASDHIYISVFCV